MKLLKPSHPPHHPLSMNSTTSGFSPPATFWCSTDRPAMSQLPEISEEEGCNCENDKVYVAVVKSLKKGVALIQWSLKKFGGQELCLVHVHQPSPTIPTLLGNLPSSQANGEVLSAYRREEKEKTEKLMQDYMKICGTKVQASFITVEAEHIPEGIVDIMKNYETRKLVMGAETENCIKVKKSSSKAYQTAKTAPSFCEIFFIYKGKHLMTQETSESPSTYSAIIQSESTFAENLRSKSLQSSKKDLFFPSESLRSSSTGSILCNKGISSLTRREQDQKKRDLTLLLCTSKSERWLCNIRNSYSPARHRSGSEYTLAESGESSNFGSDFEEEGLCNNLRKLQIEDDALKEEKLNEMRKYKELQSKAMESINRAKVFEQAHACEIERKKLAKDALRTTIKERENLLGQRQETSRELQKILKNIAVLDSQTQEAQRRLAEATKELNLIQSSLATLWQEKQRILRQKMEAERWLERWRTRGLAGSATCDGFLGFAEEIPKLAEFSLSDLQTATCNFSHSFKIAEGGYGCVYKGEMMGRTVAIKKLHPHNMRGQSEFEQEVKVLGKLKHPHLVTLLGHCSEAWSLVYEYLPNGNLQEFLSRKKNYSLLTWKTRAQIIAEIASALCFLHSSRPEMVVHGDLQPEYILLDSDLGCKICDFGLCRLVSEEILYRPSFRNTEPKCYFPYTDPEFHRLGILTPKSDVYSFGLIILQLLTGKSPVGLANTARKAVSQGELTSILDFSAGEWPMFVAEQLTKLGLQFCELNSRDRPELAPALVRELEQLHMSEERSVPYFFLCPILQEIMHDPQIAADGFTYEGEALRGWIESGHDTSPMTNLKLCHLHLVPNHSLRLAIQDWLCIS